MDEKKKGSVHRPCPKCGAERVHRSQTRNAGEKALRLAGWRALRCHDCQFRFFRMGSSVLSPKDAQRIARRIALWLAAGAGVIVCALVVRMLIMGMADPGPSG